MPKTVDIKEHQEIPWGIESVKASNIWEFSTGKGIKVAIIDSGISKHADLNIKGEVNFIEPGKPAEDDSGHGTLIAGIIAAQNNDTGVVGIAPDVELYSLKVLDSSGTGFLTDLVDSIEWCIKNNINIINISASVNKDFSSLKKVIDIALENEILIVAASGNNNNGQVGYPASYSGVISVGSLDKYNRKDEFSSIGKIDFCAPGVNILSTFNDEGYAIMSGSSMAAPHITGLLSLMLADIRNDINKDGVIKSKEVIEKLKYLAEDLGEKGDDDLFGYGGVKAN